MRRMVCFVMAFAMMLGFTQCKKDEIQPQNEGDGNQVRISLNVNGGNNGSRVNVDPAASQMVTFESGDQIIVVSNGVYVGYLEHNGTTFTGSITDPTEGQPLYFYFLGNKVDVSKLTPGVTTSCPPVVISDQTEELPVLSVAPSTDNYSSSVTSYSAVLENRCALMKFNVTAPSTAPICITGMCNAVTPSFTDHTLGQGYDGNGLIMMKGVTSSNPVTYAVVLSQEALAEGASAYGSETALLYTADNFYSTTRPAIPEIRNGKLYDGTDAVTLTLTEANSTTFDPLTTPLTFEARTAGAKVRFDINNFAATNPVEYSLNSYGWQTYTSGTAIELENVGDKVMFRGSNYNYSVPSNDANSTFSCTASCYVYGNVMSLIDKDNFSDATTIPASANVSFYGSGDNAHALSGLFQNNTYIDIHASRDLVLPATTLQSNCYQKMFYGCTGLTKAPVLPATTLAGSCYAEMFQGCTGLAVVPELPATTLANSCYDHLFYGCTSLTTSPVLPAATLESYCYNWMFGGCTNLATVTCLATNRSATNCTQSWLSGVASSGTFYKASSTTWPIGDVDNVPTNWTVVDYSGK